MSFPTISCLDLRQQEAYRSLLSGTYGMGFLVTVGTTAAYCFGIISILHKCLFSNKMIVQSDSFMTSAMLIMFILFGKMLEAEAKAKTSAALDALVGILQSLNIMCIFVSLSSYSHVYRVNNGPKKLFY